MISTVVIVVAILVAVPTRSSNDFVWKSYNNGTGFDDSTGGGKFYICCIGLLMCLFSFSGYEGAAHMSEETTNAALSAPKGILWTCIATAITGFVYILGLLYACQEQLVDSDGNSLSAVEIF